MKNLIKPLFLSLCCLATSVAMAFEAALTFGTDSPTSGKVKAAGPAAESVTVEETNDSIQIRTPNFWSCLVQADGINLDLGLSKPDSSLAIEVRGTVTGKSPNARLILFAPGWFKKSIWHFDLSDINPDTYTLVKATTPLSTPAEPHDGEALDVTGIVGVMQISTTAEETDKPWDIEIKSIQLVE